MSVPNTAVTAYDDRLQDTGLQNDPLLSKNSRFDGRLQGDTQTTVGPDGSDMFVIDVAGGSRDSAGSLTSSDTLTIAYQLDSPGKIALDVQFGEYSSQLAGGFEDLTDVGTDFVVSGTGTLTLNSSDWSPPPSLSGDWALAVVPSAFTSPGSTDYTGTYHLTLSTSGGGGGGGGGGTPSPSDLAVLDTTTGGPISATPAPYSGPVAGLQNQYIYTGSDNVNITVTDDNWFLHGGPGEDALQAHGGYNVLDGGTGSNFLTGGSGGTNTFFVDDRAPPSDVWSTVNNFHQSDDATVFFGSAAVINTMWADNEGAPGYTGLTLHVFTPNAPTASLTLPGYSSSDLGNGRLTVQFGNEADGTAFMHIIGTG